MTLPPVVFVSEPSAGWADGKDPGELMRRAGFGVAAIRAQMGATALDEPAIVSLRDRLRGQGIPVFQWVVLDVGSDYGPFPMGEAGRLAGARSVHFDGTIVNAEACLNATLPFLASFVSAKPLGLSTLATFELGEPAASWDRRQATLMQQAYRRENDWTPKAAVSWIKRPPLFVGWQYRATVNGKGRRGKLEGPRAFRTIDGLLELDPSSRRLFARLSAGRKDVGSLGAGWHPDRIQPTIRTTPALDVTADEARHDEAAIAPLKLGVYLGETTTADFWAGMRLAA